MERAVFDRMEAIDGEHWWFVARRRIVAGLVAAFAPKRPLRLLEVGAGTGSNLAMLQTFGAVDAIEPDEGARAIATARSGIAVAGGYLPDVELPDATYDVILLLDVLEHVEDDLGALRLLRRKLTPGGRLILTVPAAPWMWSGHDVAHHHHRRYSRKALEAVAREAGLTPRHVTHYNTLLYPLVAAARIAGRLSGREGGDDALPGALANRALTAVFGAERWWTTRLSMPFGVSLAMVAEAA